MTVPIEVILRDGTGEIAHAEAVSPENAILAANTLKRDARHARPIQGYHASLVATFYVDGEPVASA